MDVRTSEACKHGAYWKCVSWSAIFAGALVGLGLSFLLNLFGVGIGLAAFPTTDQGMTTFAIGGFLGLLIGGIAAMFALGWVAGYLATPKIADSWLGVVHGLTAWCLALVLTALLAAHLGHFVSVYTNFISHPTFMSSESMERSPYAGMTNQPQPSLTQQTMTNAEQAKDTAGKTVLAMFALFFAGALASCLGGYVGYLVHKKDWYDSSRRTDNINV